MLGMFGIKKAIIMIIIIIIIPSGSSYVKLLDNLGIVLLNFVASLGLQNISLS